MKHYYSYVVTKTPLRISFLGGGTDIPYFYKRYGGSTFNTAINKFVFVTVKRHANYFFETYRLNYHQSENCNSISEIKNSIIRETIKYFKIKKPLYISVISDVPSGTGLGGSSSFLVGLISALCKLENINTNKKKIFKIASHIELNILKNPIGKQDYVPAIYGGLSYAVFKKNGDIKIKKFELGNFSIPMNIFWTNKTRTASRVLEFQKKKFLDNIISLLTLKKITDKFCKNLFKNDFLNIKELINSLNHSWDLKKSLSEKISFDKADRFINLVRSNLKGAKILGAGGGGFILVLGELSKVFLKRHSKKMIYEKVISYNKGSEILIAK